MSRQLLVLLYWRSCLTLNEILYINISPPIQLLSSYFNCGWNILYLHLQRFGESQRELGLYTNSSCLSLNRTCLEVVFNLSRRYLFCLRRDNVWQTDVSSQIIASRAFWINKNEWIWTDRSKDIVKRVNQYLSGWIPEN